MVENNHHDHSQDLLILQYLMICRSTQQYTKGKDLKKKTTLVYKALVLEARTAPQCHTQIIIASHLNSFGMAMLCMRKPDT